MDLMDAQLLSTFAHLGKFNENVLSKAVPNQYSVQNENQNCHG